MELGLDKLQGQLNNLKGKLPTKKIAEILLILAFIGVAGYSVWLWIDIMNRTSDSNIPESKIISDEKASKLRGAKNELEERMDEPNFENLEIRNSYY